MVLKSIKMVRPNYKIHDEQQKIDPEKAFQDHIYEVRGINGINCFISTNNSLVFTITEKTKSF